MNHERTIGVDLELNLQAKDNTRHLKQSEIQNQQQQQDDSGKKDQRSPPPLMSKLTFCQLTDNSFDNECEETSFNRGSRTPNQYIKKNEN